VAAFLEAAWGDLARGAATAVCISGDFPVNAYVEGLRRRYLAVLRRPPPAPAARRLDRPDGPDAEHPNRVREFPGGVRLLIPTGMTRQDLLEECLDAAGLAARTPSGRRGLSARSIAAQWGARHGREIDDKTAGKMIGVGRAARAARDATGGVRNDGESAELRK
jgi:hypothetical protein